MKSPNVRGIRGKFLRQHQNKGYFASVILQVTLGESVNTVQCSDDAVAGCYDDWKQGALAGAYHALRIAGHNDCQVTVERIEGTNVDTNPVVVAVATVDGVWKALGYTPSPSETETVERVALTSWARGPDTLPDFDL